MAYGRTWHEGRTVRHHNLVTATQPPITGPINKGKGKSNTAGKGKGKPVTASPCRLPSVEWEVFETWAYSTDVPSVEFTDLCRCGEILFVYRNVTTSASSALTLELSVDNGVSWATTNEYMDITTAGSTTQVAAASTSSAITTARSGFMQIGGMQLDTDLFAIGRQNPLSSNSPSIDLFVGTGDRVDAARLRVASGNITGGSIILYARR